MRIAIWPIVVASLVVCWWIGNAAAAKNDWAEGADGATRDYYNRAAMLAWTHPLGDWADADGTLQGERAYGSVVASRQQQGASIECDVTDLVRQWLRGDHPNQGLLCRTTAGGYAFHVASREAPSEAHRPRLVIEAGDVRVALPAVADTYLEPSTYRAIGGRSELLRIGPRNNALLRFDLSGIAEGVELKRAVLQLFVERVYGSGATTIGVYRCCQGHDEPTEEPTWGLAKQHVADQDIQRHPDVLFFDDFESDQWHKRWTHAAVMQRLDLVDRDAQRKFAPLQGKALRVQIAEGTNTALNTLFKYAPATGEEPEEAFFRYYLRLGDDWNQTVSGGKMPGFSGTYGVAGWGGRKSNGTNGWSARGAFHRTIPADNPLGGLHPIGTYCYHAEMAGQYGDVWLWQRDYRGYLEKNRWYCVEQYVRLNTPRQSDGVLRAWIDGRLAFEKSNICFRNVTSLKVEQVWMNVYHGGRDASPHDQHLFIDNVVIARKYIGPLAD